MESKGKKLTVTMLGGFHMYWGGEEFHLKSGDATKSSHILQMLLYNAPTPVSTSKLIDALFAYDEVLSPSNSLKASVSLLRRQLDATILPNMDYITFHDRSYVWNELLEPEVDAHVFEALARRALKAEGDEGLALLREACEAYHGAFLPALVGVDWAEVLNVYYGNMYASLVRRLGEVLEERGLIEERLALSREAYTRLQSDEWLVAEMQCLMKLGRWDDAKKVYMDAVATMARDYDVQPSAELVEQYRTISAHLSNQLGTFPDLLDDIREETFPGGGYFCTFPGFIDSSRIIVRNVSRSGQSCYLMLVSLTDADGEPIPSGAKLDEASSKLLECVRRSLRRSDFFTQYNQSQYLVFLQGTTMENCSIVRRRIESNYRVLSVRDTRVQFECHSAVLEALDELNTPTTLGWHRPER